MGAQTGKFGYSGQDNAVIQVVIMIMVGIYSYFTSQTLNINMAQNFYTKWQDAILADAGDYVSKEYRSFQTALVREISKYAAAVGAKVASNSKGHYDTSCFIERNGKFVYISHSSGLSRMGSGVRIELDSFLIRTAQNGKDYRGGCNQYCDIANLQSMIDGLLGK